MATPQRCLPRSQQLFGASTTQAGGGGAFGQTNQLQSQLPLQSNSAQDGATLAGLRFSIDERTEHINRLGTGR